MSQSASKLVAILAADVAGYTRLMESDTSGTVAAWQAARDDVIQPLISKYSGEIVKLTGDGFLATFSAIESSVLCAIAIQHDLAPSPLEFRIGINVGDILHDGQDIHGEGVNIAARLEAKADQRGICVSGAVYDLVHNRISVQFENMGELELKNISSPVRAYRINTAPQADKPDSNQLIATQSIGYCSAPDNVQIAYSTIGEGPPVIYVANWLTHLEYDLLIPSRRETIELLSPKYTVVRYDARGNGLSDHNVSNMDIEASITDLESVIAKLELNNITLLGASQGAAIAAAYAARNPEKVGKLILYGGYARGRCRRGSPGQVAESKAFVTMIEEGWGKDIDTYVQMFGTFFMPDANPAQLAAFTKFQRIATPARNAARIQASIDDIDITNELNDIVAPTLVMHAREDARSSFEEGRRMAAAIPNARFVPLDSRNHALLPGEPALTRYLDEIESFLMS